MQVCYIHIHKRTHTQTLIHIHSHMHTHTLTHIHTQTLIHIYIYTQKHTLTHTHTFTHTLTHTHKHTHTHIHSLVHNCQFCRFQPSYSDIHLAIGKDPTCHHLKPHNNPISLPLGPIDTSQQVLSILVHKSDDLDPHVVSI